MDSTVQLQSLMLPAAVELRGAVAAEGRPLEWTNCASAAGMNKGAAAVAVQSQRGAVGALECAARGGGGGAALQMWPHPNPPFALRGLR